MVRKDEGAKSARGNEGVEALPVGFGDDVIRWRVGGRGEVWEGRFGGHFTGLGKVVRTRERYIYARCDVGIHCSWYRVVGVSLDFCARR